MNAHPQEKIKMPPEEYLEFERNSEMKHEYFDGEVFAMTGASLNHNQININISGELRSQLKESPCRAFANDMRVKVQENGKYTYPDIVAVCGDIDLEDDKFDTLLNPIAIFEILSDFTEAYDRGTKFRHYRLIPSLQEYILVSQHSCLVEKYVRGDGGKWIYSSYEGLEQAVQIECINCKLMLSEIYDGIKFEV